MTDPAAERRAALAHDVDTFRWRCRGRKPNPLDVRMLWLVSRALILELLVKREGEI